LAGCSAGPPGALGPPRPPGPLPGFLCRALLMAFLIHCIGSATIVPLVKVTFTVCTVIVGWVRVAVLIAMKVRIVGKSAGQMPIGLFQMIKVSKDISLLSLLSIEWCSFTGS